MSENAHDDFDVSPGVPPAVNEKKLSVDQKFNAAYAAIQSSIEHGDANSYVNGLRNLTELMRSEIRGKHELPKEGDLHFTYMEWCDHNDSIPDTEGIVRGKDSHTLSNTVDNHHKPHQDFPGDTTMQHNSESFGGGVVNYINERGRHFIIGALAPGKNEHDSYFQVQTTFKGFPQKPPVT